jgi:hypothetical protein
MFRFIGLCLGTLVRLWRACRSLLLENLTLRQQLTVLKRYHPRPRLDRVWSSPLKPYLTCGIRKKGGLQYPEEHG